MDTKIFLDILHTVEKLKDTTRHCTTEKGRPESVAEHSWRISFMAMLLKSEFPGCDINKVIQMCLIHDLGECFTGDIPVFNKTDEHRKIEEQCLTEWVNTLPIDIAEDFRALYTEMKEMNTIEAKIYKALDKLEALIQHNESPLKTWESNEYDLQREYAWGNVEFSKWFTDLRKDILDETEKKIERESSELSMYYESIPESDR